MAFFWHFNNDNCAFLKTFLQFQDFLSYLSILQLSILVHLLYGPIKFPSSSHLSLPVKDILLQMKFCIYFYSPFLYTLVNDSLYSPLTQTKLFSSFTLTFSIVMVLETMVLIANHVCFWCHLTFLKHLTIYLIPSLVK